PLTAFSFASFSLAPTPCKRKAAMELAVSNELPFWESFGQAFSKACAVEGAQPSSLSAESEISLTAFSFASFSLAPPSCKRKAAKKFAFFTSRCFPNMVCQSFKADLQQPLFLFFFAFC
ncbi:MAG: hypothetical protein J6B71_02760, partial [Clostridia bacterium]|nr:hypothetical protein [Clostridia bacterium]